MYPNDRIIFPSPAASTDRLCARSSSYVRAAGFHSHHEAQFASTSTPTIPHTSYPVDFLTCSLVSLVKEAVVVVVSTVLAAYRPFASCASGKERLRSPEIYECNHTRCTKQNEFYRSQLARPIKSDFHLLLNVALQMCVCIGATNVSLCVSSVNLKVSIVRSI